MTIKEFKIALDQSLQDDLQRRLLAVRWPDSIDADSWEDGSSLAFMRRLTDYWAHKFDWRAQEAALNRLPHYRADIDGLDIHFIHQPGKGPNPLPLILTHGWPGSFVEMLGILPLLTDPAAHGGHAEDAFDLVIPSLPGYGFSSSPIAKGTGPRATADLWVKLMDALGYDAFAAQGGDIGAFVSVWLARNHPQRLVGVHLNFIPSNYLPPLGESEILTTEERAFLARQKNWIETEGAYASEHRTKPQTLSYAMTDSPVGLAAWISEKFRSWSDCGGDIEKVFSLDDLLTNISLYWLTGQLDASFRMYKESANDALRPAPGERVSTPLGVAVFPHEILSPPRSWVERVFDVRRWSNMPKGGHFAAMEQPQLLAEEIRAFFRPLRRQAG